MAKKTKTKGKKAKAKPAKTKSKAKPVRKTKVVAKKSKVAPKKVAAKSAIEPKVLPSITGFRFEDEAELSEYFGVASNIDKEALKRSHSIDNVWDLNNLKFNLNKRDVDYDHVKKLMDSIRLRRVLEPIRIAAFITPKGIDFEVVRGRHRYESIVRLREEYNKAEALREKGKKTDERGKPVSKIPYNRLHLPAVVLLYKDRDDYEKDKGQRWADYSSNIPELIKKDNVFSRGKYYKEIIEGIGGGSTGRVSKSFGLSSGTIRQALNAGNLPNELTSVMEENIKIFPEKVITKVASAYSAIEKSYRKIIKDQTLKKMGVELKLIEVMMSGRKMSRPEPIPPHHRDAYKTEFEKEYNAGRKKLDDDRALFVKDSLTAIHAYILFKKDPKSNPKPIFPWIKKSNDEVQAGKGKIKVKGRPNKKLESVKAILSEVLDKEKLERTLKALKDVGVI